MKRLIQFIAKLYPKTWRDRYAVEFDALLEDVRPGWRSLFDVARAALYMQAHARKPRRIFATAAIAGTLIGFAASTAIPRQYASDGVIQVIPSFGSAPASHQAVSDRLNDLVRLVLSRASLTRIIDTFGLYSRERKEAPLEGVVGLAPKFETNS